MTDFTTSRRALIGGAALAALATMLGRPAVASERFAVQHSDANWRRRLGADRYRILRLEGTERAFTSSLLNEHRRGIFACAGCALPLFSSSTKFDSGTGWPSFWKALPGAVAYRRDSTLGMARTEEHCARCGGHLGHVFDDGPRPTGKRHCINGLSLTFRAA